MAFIVEDGTGVENANSLTSVAFADVYHADRGNVAWDGFDEADQKSNLIKATDYVVGMYSASLYGNIAAIGQSLPFPRVVAGVNVGNPEGVQAAVSELALISASGTPLLPTIARGKKRVKVGPIEVEYDGSGPMQTQFVAASLKMAPFLRQISGAQARLIRC